LSRKKPAALAAATASFRSVSLVVETGVGVGPVAAVVETEGTGGVRVDRVVGGIGGSVVVRCGGSGVPINVASCCDRNATACRAVAVLGSVGGNAE
jgi:hypothetical protein